MTVDLNTIMRNGGNGFSLTGVASGRNLVSGNIVDDNVGRGIALTDITEPGTSTIRIIDNEALRNALDLFWDQTGTNNCWKFNTFDTRDPAVLQSCS